MLFVAWLPTATALTWLPVRAKLLPVIDPSGKIS